MRSIRLLCLVLSLFAAIAVAADDRAFDPELAKRLGADERGMRMYVLCILKTGPKDAEIKGDERTKIFDGHFANIKRLADEGKLAVAGPFGKNDKSYRGLYIFNVATVEEAEKLVVLDPALQAGVFVADLTPWYGTAAMMTVAETHRKLEPPTCDIANAAPWIQKWLDAWELAANDILHIGKAPAPDLVFFDKQCVYTTSMVTGEGAPETSGPSLMGTPLKWRAKLHGGTITMPDRTTRPAGLMSYASGDKKTGPFFVMSAPEIWVETLHTPLDEAKNYTGVFLHEFAHVRQVSGFPMMGPLEDAWKFKDSFDDDMVQSHFKSNEEYVKAYNAETDLLYRAAAAESKEETRKLAAEALKMIRARQGRWFTGDEAVFSQLDSMWLSLEGSGQWIGYAWLTNPKGGGMTTEQGKAKMRGRGKWWSQEEGLGLFLVIDRLMAEWPSLVFHQPSIGAVELLERAIHS